MKPFATVILAAGQGKRMFSSLPKVCHLLSGKPLIFYPVRLAQNLKGKPIVVVVSGDPSQGKAVRNGLENSFPGGLNSSVRYAVQKKQLGTGDAVGAAKRELKNFNGTILILNGDMPLLKRETIAGLLQTHWQKKANLSFTTTNFPQTRGYGRIVRNSSKNFLRIVEEKDASKEEKKIKEVNVGIYAVESPFLFAALPLMTQNNAQKEYYITDLAKMAMEEKKKVHLYHVHQYEEFLGINTQEELAELEKMARKKKGKDFIAKGVKIIDPDTTYIDPMVRVSSGATIYPGCSLLGKTEIGKGSSIGPYAVLEDSQIGPEAKVKAFSVLEEAKVGPKAQVGPFAHLRPGAVLKEGAKVGNFVELKKTVLGVKAKANHLAYLGDSFIGENANVGAGTITCNYDGFAKHVTKIGKGVFIGSDVQFIAPVQVGEGALIAAGTTVTKDVPAGALAISRVPQENKKGWAKKRNQRLGKKNKAKKKSS